MPVLHKFHRMHLPRSTQLLERWWIPWPVSTRGWTHRTLNFMRARVSFHISYLGSTLRVPRALPLIRHILIIGYICCILCLLIWICSIIAYFLYLESLYIYIYIYIWCSHFIFLSRLLFSFLFIIYVLCHFCDKKGRSLTIFYSLK